VSVEEEVAQRLAAVRERIERACVRAGRPASAVTLVAVSKLQPMDRVRAAIAAGQRDFGESYAQHLRDRATALASVDALRWHAIGPLQSNKAKYVARSATLFHALESAATGRELGKRRDPAAPPLRCLIEVNVADEASKHGVASDRAATLLEEARCIERIEVVGLMCMPPWSEDAERARPHFARLRELAERLGLTELSMGTTPDYEVAIEEGATLVRVGTAIFGDRPPEIPA